MVDPKTYLSNRPGGAPDLMERTDELNWLTHCNCDVCQNRKETNTAWDGERKGAPFADFNSINHIMTNEGEIEMTWLHYLLCPKTIHAFFFRSRHWRKNP